MGDDLSPKRFTGGLQTKFEHVPPAPNLQAAKPPKIRTLYRYRVKAAEVTDGDTFHLKVDLGLYHWAKIPVRLDGYDTPETKAKSPIEREKAQEAKAQTAEWFASTLSRAGATVWVETDFDPEGGFGRWLGNVFVEHADGEQHKLGHHLVSWDLASIWPQRWRDRYLAELEGTR